MENLQENGTNVLETLMSKIPGYTGYRDREKSRDADRVHREFLAKGTSALKVKIKDVQAEMLRGGDMSQMARLGDLGNRIDRITERVRHASEGYSGLMAKTQVNEEELARIYEYDLSLVNQLAHCNEAYQALEAAANARENVPARVADLEKSLREFDSKIDEREKLLKGAL